ncbi:hypothetical protein Klosneuvirus_7_10 [Klosneuvirus KNV1]|uniref:BTB domain-containing protein n=1 Tax=Klosneuvirus KNV1 TaxID=1977640 RepID=A0A1V0SLF3_9VIRU|nr:hypothetical protein Klosneuvirus_7_10 [Klosneuvirus KNV1]
MDPNYFKKFFNNKEYSDFIMEDDDHNILYLHSFIMRQNEYFDTWFKSPISNKSEMRVSNIEMAKKLVNYIYGNEFTVDNNINFEDFFDLVDLTYMWLFPQKIKDQEFKFVIYFYEALLKNDINNAIPLYNYFGNHPTVTIESPKIRDRYTNPRDQDKNYNGKWLIDTIKNYVSANILNLNGGFINLPVAKFLAYDKYIMACIEHKYYDKIAEHTEVNNNTYINSLNKYINDHIQKIELTILTSKIAKFLDIENNTILSLKFNMYDQINNFDGTPDERLVKRINNYINRIINQCDKKLLNTKIMTYLEPQIQANLYVKFGEYDKLIGIQSYCIKEAFKVYYTADIFTVNQLNAILTANSIVTINDNIDKQQSSWKILYIQSFVPFKGTLYISVGQCKRKGEDIITINIHKTLSKQDKIRINNNEYTIKSMKSNNNKENDIIRPVFDLIEYTCLLDKNIDNIEEHKHYYVYKVRELN